MYYEPGKSKLNADETKKLIDWFNSFELSDIDSIRIVGYADSIGKIDKNLVLAEKRVNDVRKKLNLFKSNQYKLSTRSVGERIKHVEQKDRRVEVKLFLKPIPYSDSNLNVLDTILPPKCYTVDEALLDLCNKKKVLIKGQYFMRLLIEIGDFRSRVYTAYYLNMVDSTLKAVPIAWKKKNIGSDWYMRKRLVAYIPLEAFENYKIVQKDDDCEPCIFMKKRYDSPMRNNDSNNTIISRTNFLFETDYFFNANHQIKFRFLDFKTVRIRYPSEFFDSTIIYYTGANNNQALEWMLSKDGKYYTSTVELNKIVYNKRDIVYRSKMVYRKYKYCSYKYKPYKGEMNWFLPFCGGVRSLNSGKFYTFKIETGNYSNFKGNAPYIGVSVQNPNLKDKHQIRFLIGVDTILKLASSIRYRYLFKKFPLNMLNAFNPWQQTKEIQVSNKSFRFAIGSELKSFLGYNNYSNAEIFGFTAAIFEVNKCIFFMQYGAAFQFQSEKEKNIFGTFQFGIEYTLFNKK